jgi:hypothetical protein
MSIAGSKSGPIELTPKPTPQVEKYQTSKLLDSNTPLANITAFVEGYSWVVNYYGQVLGADDSVNPFSLETSPTIQQYRLIENMELKVQSESAFKLTKSNLEQTFEGSAVIYAGSIIPSRYDVFLADVGLNKPAVFTISDVTPPSALAESVYEITYIAHTLLDEQTSDNLKRKTVDSGFFSKDFLLSGQNPVLNEGKIKDIGDMHSHYSEILSHFCDDFIHDRSRFLLIPETTYLTYDPYLHEFLCNIVEVSQDKQLRVLNKPVIRKDLRMDIPTIWDVLFEGQARRVVTHFGIYDTKYLQGLPLHGGMFYSNLHRFVGPKTSSTVEGFMGASSYKLRAVERIEIYEGNVEENVRPVIHNVDHDDYYVFTKAFYDKEDSDMSLLEFLLFRFLKREDIDPSDIFTILETYDDWYPLERYYYTPALLLLIQYVLRSV